AGGPLRGVAGVRDVRVMAREDRPGDVRLVAYVLAGPEVKVEALRAAAAARLPRPMQPTDHVRVDAWPLTPNGKIDRSALPAPGATRPAGAPPQVAPRSEREYRLGHAFRELLGVDPHGVYGDLVARGRSRVQA